MTNHDKNVILDLLYGVVRRDKFNALSSISEKRNFLLKFLLNNSDYLEFEEPVDLNSEEVLELITDKFAYASEPAKCFEDEGYVPWLDDKRSSVEWKFYDRYERFLLHNKRWSWDTVSSIKKSTDIILDHMADPESDLFFKKQGLVIGDIQSGKTANYTGLINKAIDAGYKIIIVLAGLTRDLRNQTQRRIDREVLGFETKFNQKGKTIGVGIIDQFIIEGLTYADENRDFGDFKKYFSNHTLDKDSMTPLVAIVKKNISVLENVAKFLRTSQEYCYRDGKLNAPVLIIDDEVDQASVDTKNADAVENASAVNKAIRKILDSLNRYSYVGYTATPFANVFIDPDKEGDLYPRDFILCLESSRDYCGIKDYFGVDIKTDSDDTTDDHEEDLFVKISDMNDMFGGRKLDAGTSALKLPDSLKNAIRYFILSSAIKKQRGIKEHNSMLIHIARFKTPANTLKPIVEDYLNYLYKKLKYEDNEEICVYYDLWQKKYEPVSRNRLGNDFSDNWDNIKGYLLPAIESAITGVCVVNGDSDDQVDYESTNEGEHIIIGGDKLSRGLTLEGLIVSYYYRKSKMYDSLLQMGRWFGYRNGWIDLCRVFTTVHILNDFINAGRALETFKQDIDDMYREKRNPREVGQKILYSPTLMPTSYSKMRSAQKIKISFSGEVQQLIAFDRKSIPQNYAATEQFISGLGTGIVRKNKKVVFKNISADTILDYLSRYKDAEDGKYQCSVKNWNNYIRNANNHGELINWTVVLSSLNGTTEDGQHKISNYTIWKAGRTLKDEGSPEGQKTLLIKANIDPADFREIFEEDSDIYKSTRHYDKAISYEGFDSTTGLISIYIEDFYEKVFDGYKVSENGVRKRIYKRGNPVQDAQNVVGLAIWFPKTKDMEQSAVEVYANKDYIRYLNDDDEDTYYD